MKRIAIAAGIALAVFVVPDLASARSHHCTKTFTLPMFERAARAVYSGTDLPERGAYAHLWRYARCQRPPSTIARARAVWAREHDAWEGRRHPSAPPMSTATASWYSLSGPGACGTGAQVGLAFASLILPCGATIEICNARCATAVMKDRGPYVGGRTFDLNVNLRDAIGCSGVCTVRWRLL